MPMPNASKKSGYLGSACECPRCGRRAAFHDYRVRTIQTIGGALTCRRAYYYCRECGHGFAPWDGRVGLKTKSWSHLLRQEGGEATIAVLQEGPWPTRPALAAVRAGVLTYFRNQRHRMDYPSYEANGWFIGSGAVESACKTVVGQRLKGSGMRWSEPGGDAVCHVRALYRSERSQWDAFWNRSMAA